MTLTNHTPIARGYDPPSSHRAAEDYTRSGKRVTHAHRIMAALTFRDMTAKQIAAECGWGDNNVRVCRRVGDVAGFVEISSQGLDEQVWSLTLEGRNELHKVFGDTSELTMGAVARGEWR